MFTVVALVGCYSPQPQPGAPCPDGTCPTGLVCSPASRTCELHAVDAAVGDITMPIDASRDGAVTPDAPLNLPSLVQQTTNYAASTATLSATLSAAPAS